MAGYCDTQQRLILRNKDFLASYKSEYLQSSQIFAVNLRKSKRKNLQNQKRLKVSNSQVEMIANDQICHYLLTSSSRAEAFSRIVDAFGSDIDQEAILQGLKTSLHQNYQKPNGNDVKPEHINRLMSLLDMVGAENADLANLILEILINLSIFFIKSVNQCINKRVIPTFAKFFNSDNESLSTNMIWFITNVSSSNKELKKALLSGGFVERLIKILENLTNEESIHTVVWSLSLHINDYKALSASEGLLLIKMLKHLVRYEKEDTARFAIVIFFYLGSRDVLNLKVFVKEGIITEIFHYLDSPNKYLVCNILKLFHLIIYEDQDQHIQKLYDLGLLSKLSTLSVNGSVNIRKEVYMIYSNLAVSRRSYRQVFIQDYSFSNLIFGLLDEDEDVKTGTCTIFSNLSNNCVESDFILLFNQGFFMTLMQVLKSDNSVPGVLINDILASVGRLLAFAKSEDLSQLSQQGFEDLLNQLSSQDEFFQVSENILSHFFSDLEVPSDCPNVFSLC